MLARISAPDSRFVSERLRTVTLLSLSDDFDVPPANLPAMHAQLLRTVHASGLQTASPERRLVLSLQALLATPARINAPDSRLLAERLRTLTPLSPSDFDVPPAGLQAMLSQGRDTGAISAIGDGRHRPPSDAHFSTLSPIGALAQLAPALFGSPYLVISAMTSRSGSGARDGHAWAGASEGSMTHHVVYLSDFSITSII